MLRDYQQRTIDQLYAWFEAGHPGNPYMIDGKAVANGEPDATVFASSEILANPTACANPDAFIRAVRDEMGGRIEG